MGASPRPLTASLLLLAIPGAHKRLKPIPEGYFSFHGVGKEPKLKVRCPCGNQPVLRKGELRHCRELASSPHRCDRYFIAFGSSVALAAGGKS